MPAGTPLVLRGRANVIREAEIMAVNARRSRLMWLRDQSALLVDTRGAPELLLTFSFSDGAISAYDVSADPATLTALLAP